MSIYSTWLVFGEDDHEDGCAIYTEVEPGYFEFSDRPCDCGTPNAPIVYQGSSILPSMTDPRGGDLHVAAIPNHITRDGRDDGVEGLHDFLRVSLYADADALLLDRAAVARLRDTLTDWLDAEERF